MLSNPRATLLPSGHYAPDFHLLDQHGQSHNLEKDAGSQGTVLLFFSSFWLPGDLALLNVYAQAYTQLQEAGLSVMAISGINWETLYHLAKRIQCPYPILFDPCCKISKYYKTMLIPKFVTGRAVYGINPQKRIAFAQKQASPQQILQSLKDGFFSSQG